MSPKTKLIPADPARCQAEISTYNAFVMGGKTARWERCDQRPLWIATEKKPGPDGQRGSMSLCNACRAMFESREPERAKGVTFRKIRGKK